MHLWCLVLKAEVVYSRYFIQINTRKYTWNYHKRYIRSMRGPLLDMLHFSIIVRFLKQFTYISRRKLLYKDHSVMDVNGKLWNIIYLLFYNSAFGVCGNSGANQVKIIHKHIVNFMVYINLWVTREIIHFRLYDAVKDDTCSYVRIRVKTNTIGCIITRSSMT